MSGDEEKKLPSDLRSEQVFLAISFIASRLWEKVSRTIESLFTVLQLKRLQCYR
jgi:hypothetical protein